MFFLQDIDPLVFSGLFSELVPIVKLTAFNKEEVGAVLFGGGTDVNPKLYNDSRGMNTDVPDIRRDTFEARIYKQCLQAGIPMIGICRGSQFLTVMNGGALIQHVTNHAGAKHEILDGDHVILANSYHHQMMFPWKSKEKFRVLAKTNPSTSTSYLCGENSDIFATWGFNKKEFVEPEVVWWPKSRCLCIQGHPEWSKVGSDFYNYSRKLTSEFVITTEK